MANTYTVRFAVVPSDWKPGQAESYQRQNKATGFRWWKEGDPEAPFLIEEQREVPPPPPPVDPPQAPEPTPTPTFEVMTARKAAREAAILKCMSDGFDSLVSLGYSRGRAFLIGQEFGKRFIVESTAYVNFAYLADLLEGWLNATDEWLDLTPEGSKLTIRELFMATVIGAVT